MNNYHINEDGRVFSKKRKIFRKPFLDNTTGYLKVILSINGQAKSFSVHRLVARKFLGNPPHNKPQVNHIDGNKLNNKVSNLEWVSNKENTVKYHSKAPSKIRCVVKMIPGKVRGYNFVIECRWCKRHFTAKGCSINERASNKIYCSRICKYNHLKAIWQDI